MYKYSENYIKPNFFIDLNGQEKPLDHFIKILTQLAINYFSDDLSDINYSEDYRKKNLFSWCVSISPDYIKYKNTNDMIYLTEEIYKTLSKVDKKDIVIKTKMSSKIYQEEKKKYLAKINKKFTDNLRILHDAPKEFMDDKEIIIAAIKKHGLSLQCASNRLRDDREFALFLLGQYKNSNVYSDISDRLKDDDKLIKIAISNNSDNIRYCSDRLKDDKEIALLAVRKNGSNVSYLSDRLKADKELVYIAVSQDGLALQYASKELQNEEKLVHIAVEQNGWILEYLSNKFKDNKEIVIKACLSKNSVYQHISKRLKYDKDVAIAVLQKDTWAYSYFPYIIRNNRDVLKEAVSKLGQMLIYAPINYRWNKEIALIALKSNAEILKILSLTLKRDKEVVLTALKSLPNNPTCFQYVSERLRNDKVYIMEIMQKYNIYPYIPNYLKKDKKLIQLALEKSPYNIKEMDESVKNNKYIILELLKNHSHISFEYKAYIGIKLLEEIGTNDPVEYLQTAIAHEELEKKLSNQENKRMKHKL